MTNSRKNLKKITLVLCIAMVMIITTGCGFVGGQKEGDPKKNYLIVKADDGIYSDINKSGKIEKDKEKVTDFMWSVDATATTDASTLWGWDPKDASMNAWMRDLTITMHNSMFPKTTYNGSSDKFSAGQIHAITLEPLELTKDVNKATVNTIKTSKTLDTLHSVIKGMAAGILIAIWSMGFISQIVNEKFSMETLLKTLMQLLCGIVIINNADILVKAFADMGYAMVEQFGNGEEVAQFTAFSEEIKGKLADGISVNNIAISIDLVDLYVPVGTLWTDFGWIPAMLLMVFPFITLLMCAFKIVSIMIMRMLELLIRITLAPIPLAFSAQNGFSHESIRYFRGILACAVQPVLMMVGAASLDTIADAVMQIFGGKADDLTGMFASVALGICYMILSAFLGETKHLAKEIIG